MDRRTLLSTLVAGAAGLAGCNALSSSDQLQSPTFTPVPVPTDEPTPKSTATETPANTDENVRPSDEVASIINLKTGPRTLSLFPSSYRGSDGGAVSVWFVESATTDHPARLRATLRNTNDWENTFVLRDLPPFQPTTAARLSRKVCPDDCESEPTFDESTLYLAPTAGHELVDHDPKAERGPKGYWRKMDGPNAIIDLPPIVRLGPGESIVGEYVLLGGAERVGFPTGQYDFSAGEESGFTIAAWETNAPGPAGKSRFEGVSVPALPETKAMAWYHEASPQTVAYLAPGTERAELPARVVFTLVNHAREPLSGNPYYWKLLKLVDSEWFHVAPWGWPVPAGRLAPGATKAWTLLAFNDHAIEFEEGHPVGYLGGGRYAFEVGMSRGKGNHAALVDLVGPPVEVVPTEDVTATRNGETVIVTGPSWKNGKRPPSATLIVERVKVKRPVKLETLIPEQVMRWRNLGLRNTLAFFREGIERVVLRSNEHIVGRRGGPAVNQLFRFDGHVYQTSRSTARVETE